MSWEVEFTEQFEKWWQTLDEDEQEALSQRVAHLEANGPRARRPVVGEIVNSRNDPRMKELVYSTFRVLFIFDPRSVAILLYGGDKSEGQQWNDWYQTAIAEADNLYEEHLREIADTESAPTKE